MNYGGVSFSHRQTRILLLHEYNPRAQHFCVLTFSREQLFSLPFIIEAVTRLSNCFNVLWWRRFKATENTCCRIFSLYCALRCLYFVVLWFSGRSIRISTGPYVVSLWMHISQYPSAFKRHDVSLIFLPHQDSGLDVCTALLCKSSAHS